MPNVGHIAVVAFLSSALFHLAAYSVCTHLRTAVAAALAVKLQVNRCLKAATLQSSALYKVAEQFRIEFLIICTLLVAHSDAAACCNIERLCLLCCRGQQIHA